jgi:hypothetical protein
VVTGREGGDAADGRDRRGGEGHIAHLLTVSRLTHQRSAEFMLMPFEWHSGQESATRIQAFFGFAGHLAAPRYDYGGIISKSCSAVKK